MKGSWNQVCLEQKITERRNPYSIVIRVFSGAIGAPIGISVKEVVTESGVKLGSKKPSQGVTYQSISDLDPFTALVYSGLELLNREAITANGTVFYQGKSTRFNIRLRPKYSEEKRNDIYDRVIGI